MKHTLSVLVENKPGALMRITSMFARRGYNIDSLAVGPTERHDVSRVTIRIDCEQHTLEQIEKQMHKLVNVLRVAELEPGESVERELALLKVSAPAGIIGKHCSRGSTRQSTTAVRPSASASASAGSSSSSAETVKPAAPYASASAA